MFCCDVNAVVFSFFGYLEKPPMIEHINFGIPFLGIDYAWLRRMEASLPNPTVKQILTQWLDGGGLPVTWKSLIQDLRYRGFRQLADEIEVLKGECRKSHGSMRMGT